MKVLWVSNTPGLGTEILNTKNKMNCTGGWIFALNNFLKDKVDLSVMFHYPYRFEKFEYHKTKYYPIYTGNIIIENLKQRFFKKVYDDEYLEKYLSIIHEVEPDIIHIHGTENSFLCILGKIDIPVVISIQGNLTVINHKYHSGFHGKHLQIKDITFSLKKLLLFPNNFKLGFIKIKKMSYNERKYIKYAKYIVGRTNWDRRITRVLAPESDYFIGDEILRDGFYQNEWNNNYSGGKIIIFTTNSNNYYKGFETLCYSLNILNEAGIDVEWRVAGVNYNSLINKITKKHLGKNYPQKSLILLGSQDENRLIEYLKESHIYVMPSHIENSPNNLCEAMILGMPCIATFAGGTGSLLVDGKEGILIQDGDPWAMAGAIIELQKDYMKAIEFGKKAKIRALLRHDKEKVTNQYLDIYKKIIEDNMV